MGKKKGEKKGGEREWERFSRNLEYDMIRYGTRLFLYEKTRTFSKKKRE